MADALAVSGLAASIISLGIQIGGGIIKYLDAVKGQDEQIAFTRRLADNLTESLRVIETFSTSFQPTHAAPTEALIRSLKNVDAELKGLEDLVARFTTTGRPSKLQATFKRHVTYPLERSKITQLQDRLLQVSQALALAMQAFGLDISSSIVSGLAAVESSIQANGASLDDAKTALASVETCLVDVRKELDNRIQQSNLSQNANHHQLSGQVAAVHQAQQLHSEALDDMKDRSITHCNEIIRHTRDSERKQLELGARVLNEVIQLRAISDSRHRKKFIRDGEQRRQAELIAQTVVHRLVSKPGALRIAADSIQAARRLSQDRTAPGTSSSYEVNSHLKSASQSYEETVWSFLGASSVCRCRLHRQRRQHSYSIGDLGSVYGATTTEYSHISGCPRANAATVTQKWQAGVTFTGLGRLCQVAIQITLTAIYGAGGLSISPAFTYYPTVDKSTAPAWQILDLVSDATCYCDEQEILYGIGLRRWEAFTALALAKILFLFRNRIASPLDVDAANKSLIHWAVWNFTYCYTLRSTDFGYREAFLRPLVLLIKSLLEQGIPITKSPLHMLIESFDGEGRALLDVFDLILTKAPEVASTNPIEDPGTLMVYNGMSGWRAQAIDLPRSSPHIAEVLDCGPLSNALLANNCNELRLLLKQCPATLNERNALGQTPFHLAASSPDCLEILLETTDSLLPFSEINVHNLTPLGCALAYSGRHCRNGISRRRCSRCNCAKPLAMLLRAGSPLTLYRNDDLPWYLEAIVSLPGLFSLASERCKRRYAHHLRARRELLKKFALHCLPATEVAILELDSSKILDAKIPAVIGALERHGIKIPDFAEGADSAPGENRGDGHFTVYMQLVDPEDADIFWRLGFEDIDFPIWREDSSTPPAIFSAMCRNYPYLEWLDNHGADLLTRQLGPMNEGKALLSAHIVFWELGLFAGSYFNNMWPITVETIARLDVSRLKDYQWPCRMVLYSSETCANLYDQCRCRCSVNGCSPFIFMLKAFAVYCHANHNLEEPAPFLGYLIFLGDSGENIDRDQHRAAFRFFTFEALGLAHTCCHPNHDDAGCRWRYPCVDSHYTHFYGSGRCRWNPRSDEEIGELESEHAYELGLLEELLLQLETQFDSIADVAVHDINHAIQFWKNDWKAVVSEALENLDGDNLTDDEILGGQRAGVVWEPAKEDPKTFNPYNRRSLDYWFFKLDQIVPEVPWKGGADNSRRE
ncbi:hypothetical protein B0T21DRAFT_389806 [Apiosordaria backusii]|uniref:Fungal N-terminal domain-containing protein n=1 Tax=Apiosordaria backusii TaxID=314023 RepID=A0AA40ES40_9PEZI|nr:hypothetical protein B0T21DRAFT_389806 [Apiosordaria backusii]